MNKKGNPLLLFVIAIVLLIVVGSFVKSYFLLSFFQKKDINMIQYAGSISESWDRPEIVKSGIAKFDGYEITTQIQSSGCTYSDWYCAPNTCNGVETGTDEYGCPIYENNLCYAQRRSLDPYQNANCKWTTSFSNGVEYYSSFYGNTGCGLTVTNPCGSTAPYCYSYTCQSKGIMQYNLPVSGSQQCGGRTRDQKWCGTGCFARFTIKKDGVLMYDSEDYLRTQETKVIPVGATQQTIVKTLCQYESTGENYLPCIYEESDEEKGIVAGDYAPISYCEEKYGDVGQCDDVLVNDYVTKNLLDYSRGEDVYLDYKLLRVLFNYNSVYDSGSCRLIENAFSYIIPDDAFNFTVTVPEGQVMQGNEINLELKIRNNWQPVKGNLSVYFEIPTVLSNPSTEIRSKIIDIPLGESIHTYSIPTEKTTDLLKVHPTLHVLMEGSAFEGVNGICFGQADRDVRNLNSCDYVSIGTVYDDVHEVQIVPHVELVEVEKVVEKEIIIEKEVEKPGIVERAWLWLKSLFDVFGGNEDENK